MVPVMDTPKLADVSLGVKVHSLVNGPVKPGATILCPLEDPGRFEELIGVGKPRSWLLLHDNPIPARNVLLVGVQFADLCSIRGRTVSA